MVIHRYRRPAALATSTWVGAPAGIMHELLLLLLVAGKLLAAEAAAPDARAADVHPGHWHPKPPTHLKYWFDGDFVPALQQGITNLGLVVGKPSNTKACGNAFCDPSGGADALTEMQAAFDTYGTPSVAYAEMDCQGCGLGIMDTTSTMPPGPGDHRSYVGLDKNWENNLDAFAARLMQYVVNGSCAGIFICDECMSAGINYTSYDAVVSRFRTHFPRNSAGVGRPIIMANDGMQFWRQVTPTQKLPAGLDYWSFDLYDGFNINASWEVAMVRRTYEAELFPRLNPGQKVFVVPGVFGCVPGGTPGHIIPSMEAQQFELVKKLQLYFDWIKTEPRIAGVHSWHFKNRSHASHSLPRRTYDQPVAVLSALSLPGGETQCGPVKTRPGHLCSSSEFCCESILACMPQRDKQKMGSLCTADPHNPILHAGHCPCAMGAVAFPDLVAEMRRLSPAKSTQSLKADDIPRRQLRGASLGTALSSVTKQQFKGAGVVQSTTTLQNHGPSTLPRNHLKYMTWYDQCRGALWPESATAVATPLVFPDGPACSWNVFATQSQWQNVVSGDTSWSLDMLPMMASLQAKYPHLIGLPSLTNAFTTTDRPLSPLVRDRDNFTEFGWRLVNDTTKNLQSGWETILTKVVSLYRPYLSNRTILGLFVGDEIVGSGDWSFEALDTVSNKLRESLGPTAMLYTNEDDNIDVWDTIPAGLSHISYDDYDNHNTNGTSELERQWEYVHDSIVPRFSHPDQRVFLVPGLFANDPVKCILHLNTTCPLDKQQAQVMDKLVGFIAWSKADVMVAGWKGWHLASYGEGEKATYSQTIGALAMPAVVDMLVGFGQYIINDVGGPDLPPTVRETIVPISGPDDPILLPYSSIVAVQRMTARWPKLLGAHTYPHQSLLGDDLIVVKAQGNSTVWLPPGGWMEMNSARARMTWSGGIHKECPPNTVDYPNASTYFGYCKHRQYTEITHGCFTPQANVVGPTFRNGSLDGFAKEMYVREGAIISTRSGNDNEAIVLNVFPGLCPGVLWRATQFGGDTLKNCQNKTQIGISDTRCPIYGRFPCSTRVGLSGTQHRFNVSQSRRYDKAQNTMAIAVTLDDAELDFGAGRGPGIIVRVMHTSPPAVANVTVATNDMPAVTLGSSCWWLARQGPWWAVVVNASVTLGNSAAVTVYMW